MTHLLPIAVARAVSRKCWGKVEIPSRRYYAEAPVAVPLKKAGSSMLI
jgi:hypothetical protein